MNRRHFLRGLLAAPAIVHAGNLMPVKKVLPRPQDLALVDIETGPDYVAYTFKTAPKVVLGWQPSFLMVKKELGLGNSWTYFHNGAEVESRRILDLSNPTPVTFKL